MRGTKAKALRQLFMRIKMTTDKDISFRRLKDWYKTLDSRKRKEVK
jgi:hypothetical protein